MPSKMVADKAEVMGPHTDLEDLGGLDDIEETLGRSPLATEQLAERSPLVILADAAMALEKVRVAAQVRQTHLAKRGKTCPDTKELLIRLQPLEKWADDRLTTLLNAHPASGWFMGVKGARGEVIGKVLGHIEAFGRFYEEGDPMIPSHVNRPAVTIADKPMIWVEAIERFTTPSKLCKYAGLIPGQKRVAGQKLGFNIELRTMLWRLGGQMIKATGKYYEIYCGYKERKQAEYRNAGIKILPTPMGRYCIVCEKEVAVKKAIFCPECGEKLALKNEPEGVVWEGHLHMMCQRRMIKLFLSHFWAIYREVMQLPTRQPYAIEHLGHSTIISPWDMVER